MSLSRWKMMAGVLGVSLGGLAAIAGQCPKNDASKTARRSSDPPVEFPAPPMVPPAGSASAGKGPVAVPDVPPPMPMVAPEKMPVVPMPDAKPLSAPVLPPLPGTGSPPPMPVIPASGATIPAPPAPTVDVPKVELPKPGSTPPAPPAIELPKPSAQPTPPPTLEFTKPATPSGPATPSSPPSAAPSIGIDPPPVSKPTQTAPSLPADPVIEPQPTTLKPRTTLPEPTAGAVQTKFRILLRVGEGEPTFEVKCGDNIVLKVVCEKVDIKSPEKGTGLSAVKASGRVRFVGFGAEGTCDELAFLAGTGEVSMTGAVKVQVKDKLGRVESELSTEAMKYRIDACAVGGALKP